MNRRLAVLAAAIFASSWLILAVTAPGIPIVWDEGEYLFRAQRIIDWVRLSPPDFSRDAIQRHWLFITYSEGHPAGFAIPIALGKAFASPFLDPLTAARLGPITLFSAACAAIAVRLKKDYGTAAAVVAPVTLLTFPRMFSEAHFATQDGQLTAWWLLLWAVQSAVQRSTGLTVMIGLVLGFTTATKFTGWLAWGPAVVSEAVKKKSAGLGLLVILPVALLTFYAVNPNLWYEPLDALKNHFDRNLNRANTFNISTLFLGRIYNVENPLPWYNTAAWLLLVTPLATLGLGFAGIWRCLTRPTAASIALILHWMTMMIARALPGAPPHDGIRLFLPAFGFWCVFAGVGAQSAYGAISALQSVYWRAALRAALVVALLASAVDVARYYPQTLSHYSLLAGGVAGAARKGMEPAYWWDALDNDVLSWINQRTGPDEGVAFSPAANLALLREWRRLVPRPVDPQRQPFKWYVLQNRPGMFTPVDRALMRREQPAYVKYPGRRRAGEEVPADLQVPLILVFSFDQYQRARR
jgi:hypothetical protein